MSVHSLALSSSRSNAKVRCSSLLGRLWLLAALAIILAPPAAQAEEEPGTGAMYLLAGDCTLAAPPVGGGTVPAKWTASGCINLGQQNTATAPDGTVYISDPHGVILRVEGDMVRTLASGFDNPWGIDVDRSGMVYFAEYQAGLGWSQGAFRRGGPPHTAGRVWRLDPGSGAAAIVAVVPGAADVRVGPQNLLYVASWNWYGAGGVWKVDISGAGVEDCNTVSPACTQLLGSGQTGSYDAEGIALFADAQGNQRLYVAAYGAAWGTPKFGGAGRCIWEIDLNQVSTGTAVSCSDPTPPPGYQVIQQPDFPPVPVVGSLGGDPICPTCYVDGWATDLEFDASGTLHVLLSDKVPGEPGTFPFMEEQGFGWGGHCPRVIAVRPGETSYVINLGDYSEGCIYGGPADPPDEAPAAAQQQWWGHSISLGNGTSLLFSLRNGRTGINGEWWFNRYKTYEVRDTVPGMSGPIPRWSPRIYFPTQCQDGVDNDGDELTDWPNDPGCVNAADVAEAPLPCDDGVDNDEDGATDYLADIGCKNLWGIEDAQCSNGLDDEFDSFIDFDGGVWAGVPEPTDPDDKCDAAWEEVEACGIGWELGAVLPPLMMWRSWRRRRQRP